MELTGTARLRARWPTAKVFLARRRPDWILGIFCGAVMLTIFLRGWATPSSRGPPGIICAICGFCWRNDRWCGGWWDADGALKYAATLRTGTAGSKGELFCAAIHKGAGACVWGAHFFLGALSCDSI